MKRLCFVTTVSMTVRAFVIPVIRYFSEMTDWEITVICNDDPTLEQDLPTGTHYFPMQNRLLLIGSIENRDTLDEKLLRDAENDPHVLFHEYVDDIERYYAAMDVLVLPSYREGFGNIIIEAQAMGVPVIVTDIPGPIDAMKPMETGLSVPVADIDALSTAMNTLAKDSALRSELGRHGRKLVEEQFDQKILLDHFLQERKLLLNMPD